MIRRGVTLLELLVVVAIIGVITAVVTRAYVASIDYEQKFRAGRDEADRFRLFEDRLKNLFKHAYLSQDAGDSSTYFVGGDVSGETSSGPAESVTFTTAGMPISSVAMAAEDDFETLNNRIGPQGGVAEVTLGLTPIGQAANAQGLFIRDQRPSDGDPTQGGFEQVFSPDVDRIQFEFFDGTQWQASWDTRTGEKRLPAAVRVQYRFQNEDVDHTVIAKLPLSDVTPLNPLQTETTQ